MIPVVGKEEEEDLEDATQTGDPDVSKAADAYAHSQKIYPDNSTIKDEVDMPLEVNDQVGVSINYIYELYQNDLGENILDLRISMPQIYYSNGIPLQNANDYYIQYLNVYRTKIETETLEIIMGSNKIQEDSRLSTVEMNFSVTYK